MSDQEPVRIVAELLPRIRCCSFYVHSIKKPSSVTMVQPDSILIKTEDNDQYNICVKDLRLDKDSLTVQTMTSDTIYFKIKIIPETVYGSYQCEVLVNNSLESSLPEPYKMDIQVKKPVQLLCRNCQSPLHKENITFDRVLPLPSSGFNDFFCHKHDNGPDLSPRNNDLLYSNFYFKINPLCLDEDYDKVVKCCGCSSWLGLKESSSITLWNSCVIASENDKQFDVPEQALSDFCLLVKSLIKNFPGATCRLILTSKFDDEPSQHLLLWVMDKTLQLLINDAVNDEKITLKKVEMVKVLYVHGSETSDLVEEWKSDMRVMEEQISKQMMTEGLHHLKDMSTMTPADHRKFREYSVSYIK